VKDGMGITENIDIERAHRTGKDAIVVKLLSFKQKSTILSKARKLKDSEKFQNVFVREDFSTAVRKKRQGLREKEKQLRNVGQKPKLRFDKLITADGVFTYDLDKQEIQRLAQRSQRRQGMEDEVDTAQEELEGAVGGVREQTERPFYDWNHDPWDFPPLNSRRQQDGEEEDFLFGSQYDNDQFTSHFSAGHGEPNQTNSFKDTEFDTPTQSSMRGHPTSSEVHARARRSSNIPMRVRSPVQLRQRSYTRPSKASSSESQPRIDAALRHTSTTHNKSQDTQHAKGARDERNNGQGRDGEGGGRGGPRPLR